ncbi:MAG TPA: xanthine dehydrogenase family protein subunit M [Burkholderiales bacterium]|nr:xanthine dehydrogenase family protein subunit M [Burkholderiales bacterium]
MKAPPFEYARAASLEEACALLQQHGDAAKLLAGGQSLVPMMAMRLLRPAWLVDINEIGSLKQIIVEADGVRTAACARQVDLERDAALGARLPLLHQALAWVGHVQTRNRGTVGGSLAHADPCAELPLVAQLLGAQLQLRSAKGARSIEANAFFDGPMSTALAPDECLEAVHWPAWSGARVGSAFSELATRHGDFAMVSAAAQIALDAEGRCLRAALGLGGVGLTPLAFPALAAKLVGARPADADFDDLARDAAAQSEPGDDLHASAAYRRHVARVLAARVLREACRRAESLQ